VVTTPPTAFSSGFVTDPCKPESFSIALAQDGLPAMPYHAAMVGGNCKCYAPQACNE